MVKLKHISNFTDFQSLALQPGVRVRYAQNAKELESADLIVLPGTKNTIEDLNWLKQQGIADEIWVSAAGAERPRRKSVQQC